MKEELRPQGMNRPKDNGSEWYNKPASTPPDIGGGEVQPRLRERQHRAMDSGRVTGSTHETGVAKSRSPRDYNNQSYGDRSFAGAPELGHPHLGHVSDIQAGDRRASFIDAATLGTADRSTESQKFGNPSAGIQRLPTGRENQTILSGTPPNNVGRMYGFPESSIRQPTRGSTTNEGSTNHTPNIFGSGIRQDDPNISGKVNERASGTLASGDGDDDEGYAWLRHQGD
jgi:hypothetical protein